jgi:uncharacterized protein
LYNFIPPPKLGVGFTYQRGLLGAIDAGRGLIDFFEITPDLLCHEKGGEAGRTLEYHPALLGEAIDCCAESPAVVHGLGLSIGSVSGWNESYIKILDALYSRWPFAWHSEHIGFLNTTYPDGRPLYIGVPLPLPFTDEAVDLLARRAQMMCERYGRPFLLENLAYYLPGLPSEGGRDEVEFLNDIVERSGCGLLLDLYNFYCNAVNLKFDPLEALSRLKLDRVVEIHLAGGAFHDGFLTDAHCRVVPEPVWQLLEWVAPRAQNLSAIVYEVLEQAFDIVGIDGVCAQLERAQKVWQKHCAPAETERVYAAK